MSSELSLFLGGHTDKFTDWLHAVLEKLEAYVVSTNTTYKKGETNSSTAKTGSESFVFSLNNIPEVPTPSVYQVPTSGLTEANNGNQSLLLSKNSIGSTDQYVPLPISVTSVQHSTQPPLEDMEEDCLNIREEVEADFHPDDKLSKQKSTSTQRVICNQ